MSRWIKIEIATPEKDAILSAMENCGCSQGDAFLAFFRLYGWLDEQTADGRLPKVGKQLIDFHAGLKGFADSLEQSGWLTFTTTGCIVTNWGKHNGQCAKRRAMDAVRKAAIREELRRQGLPVRPCPKFPKR